MFKIAVAHSLTAEMQTAAESLVKQARDGLEGCPPNVGLLFSSFGLDHAGLLSALAHRLPECPLIGGSAYGEVSGGLGYRLGSSLLILIASDRVRIHAGVVRDLTFEDEEANAEIIEQGLAPMINGKDPPVLGLLFPDGVGLDGASIVRLFADRLPQTRLFGGATAENFRLNPTVQFYTSEVLTHSVPFVFFSGPLRYSWSVTEGLSAGWSPTAEPVHATCDANRIKTIDGTTALGYLESVHPLNGGHWSLCHPFAVYPDPDSDAHALRDVIRYDRATGTLESLQSLPPECRIQLTQPDPEAILLAARRALQETLAHYPDLSPPAGVFWFSAATRALALSPEPAMDYRTATDAIAPTLPVAGFYTYGEIAPAGPGATPGYHNCSLTTLALGEESRPDPGVFNTLEAISTANLQREIKTLAEALRLAQAETVGMRQALDEYRALEQLGAHCRTEQNYRYRALALELLCEILDTRNGDLRRLAFKGDPPRLNKSGLARLIDDQHRRRHGAAFPLTLGQLARLLGPKQDYD